MMKWFSVLALLLALAAPAFAVSYTNDFETEDLTGWTVNDHWESWHGGMTATVDNAPGGGKALKLVWDTDWSVSWLSSGLINCPTLSGFNADNDILTVEFDMYRTHNGLHQWSQALDDTEAGGIGMWPWYDHPGNVKKGWNSPDNLDFVPDNAWIHVVMDFDAQTDLFTTTLSHSVPGYDKADPTTPWYGGSYSGSYGGGIRGFWSFSGTAVAAEMREGRGLREEYDNATYFDNFSISVNPVPEPGSMLALGSGLMGLVGFALRRRK